jgi:subtilisin family serine protease
MRRYLRATTSTALVCLLSLAAASPAQAATPRGWETKAMGLDAAQSVNKKQGAGITVAVLDTGVIPDHPALKGRVVNNGPDYVDDGRSPGDPLWGEHGTAMASDVLKVAPRAEILPVRVITDDEDQKGLSDRDEKAKRTWIAKGIDYALKHGADVISMSLGGEGEALSHYETSEADALGRAAQRGVPVLASAGNEGLKHNDGSYPAGYPSVIAVAATDKDGTRAPFSTVGSYVALAAPGIDIYSAKNTGGYYKVNGTSPAAALTSGVAALMLSANPDLTPSQVRNILTSTAHHPSGGRNDLVGHGQINAAAAVKRSLNPPKVQVGPNAHEGQEHFAAPDGTTPTKGAPVHTEDIAVTAVAILLGAGVLTVGILIIRRSRRPAHPHR